MEYRNQCRNSIDNQTISISITVRYKSFHKQFIHTLHRFHAGHDQMNSSVPEWIGEITDQFEECFCHRRIQNTGQVIMRNENEEDLKSTTNNIFILKIMSRIMKNTDTERRMEVTEDVIPATLPLLLMKSIKITLLRFELLLSSP